MVIVTAAQIDTALSYPRLLDVLEQAFRAGAEAPPRQHIEVKLAGRPAATWLLMPAISGAYMGVKSVTVFPDNMARSGSPTVSGTYLLLSTDTGATLAMLDATRLTLWRTAAASALAARVLARPDSTRLLMVGCGALAPFLIRAHASVLPICNVRVWNRSRAAAEKLAALFAGGPLDVQVVDDLAAAARTADVISTATLSKAPLILGEWLAPGTHVDSVGAFRADMRETDDTLVAGARVFVDTFAGAFSEAGDIVQPLAAGIIDRAHVLGELADLVTGAIGRGSPDAITFFKSVGASLEDLATAVEVYQRLRVVDNDAPPTDLVR